MIDMHRALQEMRKKFYSARKGWFYSTKSDLIPPLPGFQNSSLARFWEFQPQLLQQGTIYWSKVVNAFGPRMYYPGSFHWPAEVVVSPQPLFESDPDRLSTIAEVVERLKYSQPSDPDLAAAAAEIYLNSDYPLAKPVPAQFSEGHEVYRFAVFIYRPHVPNERLHALGFYPVLLMHGCPFAMVLPRQYWSADLLAWYSPTEAERIQEEARRRKQQQMPPVVLTTAAQEKLMATMVENHLDPLSVFVRVSVLPNQNYHMDFAKAKQNGDTEFNLHDFRVLVDPYMLQNFRGIEVDWKDFGTSSGFWFTEYLWNSRFDDEDEEP